MMQPTSQHRWQTNWVKPSLLSRKQPVKPVEIGEGLRKTLTAPENILEDADYKKVLPNHFVVEVSQGNFLRHYEPLRADLIQQWRDQLVEHLLTANSRLGRKEYRFGGPLQIELRFALDLADTHARILSRVEPDAASAAQPVPRDRGRELASLELLDGSRRWSLYAGDNTVGRDSTCSVYLDLPVIQEKRLVSAHHAVIRLDAGHAFLYDGSPSGKPSANGTYLGSRRIDQGGVPLQDGDTLILAALNPLAPRLDTPGAAVLRFRQLARQPL